MGYDFYINPPWFKIKLKEKEYSWPCDDEPNRKITLYNDDVLTRSFNGSFMKHTGIGCLGIQIPSEDLIEQTISIKLRLL